MKLYNINTEWFKYKSLYIKYECYYYNVINNNDTE